MKITGFILFVFIAASMPFCRMCAQSIKDSYVINNNNDTIKCEIKVLFFGSIKYKPLSASNNKYILASPSDIKEYHIAGNANSYVAIALADEGKIGYISILEKGRINLYEKITSNENGYSQISSILTRWYVSKDYAPLQKLKSTTVYNGGAQDDQTISKKSKEYFLELIADDGPLFEKFRAETDFSYSKLQYYVHQYNLDKLN